MHIRKFFSPDCPTCGDSVAVATFDINSGCPPSIDAFQALNDLLNSLSPRCAMTVAAWQGLNLAQKFQVILNKDCPSINPVANITYTPGTIYQSSVLVMAANATDADGFIVGYLWTKVSGPAGDIMTGTTTPTCTVTFTTPGSYVFRVVVTDDRGLMGQDDQTITVLADATGTYTIKGGVRANTGALPTSDAEVNSLATITAVIPNTNPVELDLTPAFSVNPLVLEYGWIAVPVGLSNKTLWEYQSTQGVIGAVGSGQLWVFVGTLTGGTYELYRNSYAVRLVNGPTKLL